jgi:nicotinate dehydrogenase subunit A
MVNLTLTVIGKPAIVSADDPPMPLLYAPRNDTGLHGPRFGRGLAQCGACTVHVDGKAVRSCAYPVSSAAGKKVVTLEGLGNPGKPHSLQQAFIEERAAQCGYCINGMIMQAKALLDSNEKPHEAQIREALKHNRCRLRHPSADRARDQTRLRDDGIGGRHDCLDPRRATPRISQDFRLPRRHVFPRRWSRPIGSTVFLQSAPTAR